MEEVVFSDAEKSDAAMVQMMQSSLRNRAKILARGD